MAARMLATFGLGATVGVAVTALVTGTLSGPEAVRDVAGDVGRLVGPPPAAAEELPAFDDCEQLRRQYVEAALPSVGPWGFGGQPFYVDRDMLVAADVQAAPQRASAKGYVENSGTGTNVQEAGVDEPDHVKTDGEFVYRVRNDRLVVHDVRGSTARPLSRIELPGPWMDQELLLVDDTVLVLGTAVRGSGWGYDIASRVALPSGNGRTHVTEVDVSAPGAPRIESHQRIDGAVVAAREYGGTVRLVVSTDYPPLDFVHPNRDRSRREARRLNRQIVRDTTVEDWLPALRTEVGGVPSPLLECNDVRRPRQAAGFGTISILTFAASDPTSYETTAVMAAGDLVYSSEDRLYVATLPTTFWETRRRIPVHRTSIHAFALEGTGTTYRASGTVPGAVRNRWSMDERDGRLRVATALGRGWRPREHAVSVLEETGQRLEMVGSVDGLGRREAIQSVRWFDDVAVVVTFRQVDPLYTVDLSDPRDPRVLGELKIRGFSAYLHPLGNDLLLGVGQAATQRGADLGAQVATFDLGDLRSVTRPDTHGFGPDTQQGAGEDPRSFTYLPEERLAFVGVGSWRSGRDRVVALRVGPDGSLAEERSWESSRWWSANTRVLPLGDGRVAIVDRAVRVADLG